MSHLGRAGFSLVAITMALTAGAQTAHAQAVAPNPYATVPGVWGQLPEARAWGSTSAVYPSPDGNTIWVGERCGENNCQGRDDIDPNQALAPDVPVSSHLSMRILPRISLRSSRATGPEGKPFILKR